MSDKFFSTRLLQRCTDMTEKTDRIEQFQKMAQADPNNELGHFSLGRAYEEAGRDQEAAGAYEKAISLNPKLSKVYQLLGGALLRLGRKDEAIVRWTEGVKIADERGDSMPREEMVKLLRGQGAPLPTIKASSAAPSTGEGDVMCSRCGQVKKKMAGPPYSNAQGKMIYERVCADCWRDWIHMGTKVINELRLPLSDPQAQKVFDQHMIEFLCLN